MCGLKKLASGVFPESWKVLAERWWRRLAVVETDQNNKSPGSPGRLNDQSVHINETFKCYHYMILHQNQQYLNRNNLFSNSFIIIHMI